MTANAFVESEERQALRKAVAAMAANYGQDYYLEKARAGQHTDELWQEAGKLGFIGVNLPEEYGGGGAGMYELSIVMEEMSARRLPAVVDGGLPRHQRHDHRQVRHRRAEEAVAARYRRRLDHHGVRDHRARRGLELAPHHHHRPPRRQRLDPQGPEGVHLRCRPGAGGAGGGPHPKRPRPATCGPRCSSSPPTLPGSRWTKIDMELVSPESQFQVFIDDVRLPSDALVGSEDAAIAQLFAGLNPERIMGAASAVGMGRFAINKAVDYVKTRQVWKTPIGAHQGLSHPLAQNHIEIELAKLMMQKAATLYDNGDDVGAAEAANMAKYAAAEASVRAVDQAVQSLGGNGLTKEYGIAAAVTASKLARIAPVSREMVLNFIAQTSLGLPRSY